MNVKNFIYFLLAGSLHTSVYAQTSSSSQASPYQESTYYDSIPTSRPQLEESLQEEKSFDRDNRGLNRQEDTRWRTDHQEKRNVLESEKAMERDQHASSNRVAKTNEELTLVIIKPDAVEANHLGDIISRFEKAGLRVAGIKMVSLTEDEVGEFYSEHKGQPYYKGLVEFMSSSPAVVVALEGKNAVLKVRHLIGATDPVHAEPGTIRADFGESKSHNAVHSSDSQESRDREVPFFFQSKDIHERYE